jgi:hypothetical protein
VRALKKRLAIFCGRFSRDKAHGKPTADFVGQLDFFRENPQNMGNVMGVWCVFRGWRRKKT